jgi:tryptophanyl-tRNA synthetase
MLLNLLAEWLACGVSEKSHKILTQSVTRNTDNIDYIIKKRNLADLLSLYSSSSIFRDRRRAVL